MKKRLVNDFNKEIVEIERSIKQGIVYPDADLVDEITKKVSKLEQKIGAQELLKKKVLNK